MIRKLQIIIRNLFPFLHLIHKICLRGEILSKKEVRTKKSLKANPFAKVIRYWPKVIHNAQKIWRITWPK